MKMHVNRLPCLSLITLNLALATTALAQGSRGGGEIVRAPTGVHLRDQVDAGMCTWTPGSEIIERYPSIEKTIAAIASLDWYFAFSLKREIESIDYCFVATELIRPKMDDDPGVLVYVTPRAEMLGVRVLGEPEVYVQKNRLVELNSSQKALFFIHEAMHSFLDFDEPGRQIKLMRTVNLIDKAARGDFITGESFRASLRRNQIRFPESQFTSSEISFLNYALSSNEGKKKLILAGRANVADLIRERSYEFAHKLTQADARTIQTIKQNLPFNLFGQFCGDLTVTKALNIQSSDEFNFAIVCLNNKNDGSSEVSQISTESATQFFANFYQNLSRAKISIRASRVGVSSELEKISTSGSDEGSVRHLLDLRAVTEASDSQLHSSGREFESLVVALSRKLPTEEWVNLITGDKNFRKALSGKGLVEQVEDITDPDAMHEAQNILELNYIPFLYQSFLQSLVRRVELQSGEAQGVRTLKTRALVDAINAKGLGYTIQSESGIQNNNLKR